MLSKYIDSYLEELGITPAQLVEAIKAITRMRDAEINLGLCGRLPDRLNSLFDIEEGVDWDDIVADFDAICEKFEGITDGGWYWDHLEDEGDEGEAKAAECRRDVCRYIIDLLIEKYNI